MTVSRASSLVFCLSFFPMSRWWRKNYKKLQYKTNVNWLIYIIMSLHLEFRHSLALSSRFRRLFRHSWRRWSSNSCLAVFFIIWRCHNQKKTTVRLAQNTTAHIQMMNRISSSVMKAWRKALEEVFGARVNVLKLVF